MDSSGFSAARWDHWLLVVSFLGLAGYGLRLSWQWRRIAKQRQRSHLARRLTMEIHGHQQPIRPSAQPVEQRQPDHTTIHFAHHTASYQVPSKQISSRQASSHQASSQGTSPRSRSKRSH
ncbi:MAG: hypothetical protein AAFQ63_18990 [Cyanobacteria bacterium J06621_11]